MVCRCGYQNEPDDFYCAQCGRRLAGKKSGKGWIIAVVVVLALVAGALAMWFVLKGDAAAPEEGISSGQPEGETGETPPAGEEAEEQEDCWSEDGLCYYVDGEKVTGLYQIDGAYYYFAPDTGEKQTGWQEIDGNWHFFTEEGPAPGAGWYSDEKGWFFLEHNGMHRTDSFTDEENKREFFLDEEGYLAWLKYQELTCILDKAEVDGSQRQILVPVEQLSGCTGLTFTVTGGTGDITALSTSVNEIWIRVNEEWKSVKDTAVRGEDGTYLLTFSSAVSFDAICIFVGQDITVTSPLTNVIVSYK